MAKYSFWSEDMRLSSMEYYFIVEVFCDKKHFARAHVDIDFEQKREVVYLGYTEPSDKLSENLESELKSQILKYCHGKIETKFS